MDPSILSCVGASLVSHLGCPVAEHEHCTPRTPGVSCSCILDAGADRCDCDASFGIPICHRGVLSAESLRLGCDALETALALSPFVVAHDLVMEKLCYQAIARSIDHGAFAVGLRAAAFLQMILLRRPDGDSRGAEEEDRSAIEEGAAARDSGSCLCLDPGDGTGFGGALQLGPFAPPKASRSYSLEVAKLVSGASLNTCRCCLELGSVEAWRLMLGELGRSAALWIERVSELGEVGKAGELILTSLSSVISHRRVVSEVSRHCRSPAGGASL